MNPSNFISVAFRGVFGGFVLDAAFTTPTHGVTALFGPSGCGKTTVLRCIAGLQRLADGYCAVNGDVWHDGRSFRPVHQRPIGYVFQEPGLFPHLTVTGNLLYGAPGRSPLTPGYPAGFDEVVALLGLEKLLDRAPRKLSGGERQRVAIGRALLSRPQLLLMDEPLSALDPQARDEVLPFLRRLHDSLSLPFIYVSHDMREIEQLADHLVLMRAGRVLAAGPLGELQGDPALPLASRRDAAVTLDAVVSAYDPAYGIAMLAVDGGCFTAPMRRPVVGGRRRITIAAGDVSLAREAPRATTVLNTLPVRILSATPAAEHEIVAVLGLGPAGAGSRILARVTRLSWENLRLAEGNELYAQIKSVALVRECAK